jgi:acyl-CoA synthetase (AMP-forming)/AMP-acid ligase II
MPMDFRQIAYFLRVYDAGSFNKASRQAHVAQPALSVQIARLEEELNVSLFERHANGVVPTLAGRRFYAICQRIVQDMTAAKAEMAAFSDTVSGRFTVGLPPSACRTVLGEFLPEFAQRYPNVEIVVVRDDGVTAAPGEVGELVARGSNISRGYWNHASETAERFGPIGYRTGDLGYADEQGFLYLVGRRHDMLKVGAHRVAAKEIEDVLNEYPAIHEAAVVPIPHEILGEAPLAFVATLDGSQLGGADIVRFCRQRLAPHKVPVEFIPMDTLPKGLVGKVDKLALKRIAAQRQTSLGPDMPAWASGESGPRTSRDLR